MLNEYLSYIQESSKTTEYKLVKMDERFMRTIKDYKEIYYHPNAKNYYYTLIKGNDKIAVTGVIMENGLPFFQIAILGRYRGQGILGICADLLSKKHDIGVLYSTISSDNIQSRRAHEKAGFKRIDLKLEKRLQDLGKLQEDQVRYYKEYK